MRMGDSTCDECDECVVSVGAIAPVFGFLFVSAVVTMGGLEIYVP